MRLDLTHILSIRRGMGRWFFKQNLSRDLEIETNNPLSNGYGYFLKKW